MLGPSYLMHLKVLVLWLLMAVVGTEPIIQYFTWDRAVGRIGETRELCILSWKTPEPDDSRKYEGPMDCLAAGRIRDRNPQISYRTRTHRYSRVFYESPEGTAERSTWITAPVLRGGGDYPPGSTIELVVNPRKRTFVRRFKGWNDWWYIVMGVVLPPIGYIWVWRSRSRHEARLARRYARSPFRGRGQVR